MITDIQNLSNLQAVAETELPTPNKKCRVTNSWAPNDMKRENLSKLHKEQPFIGKGCSLLAVLAIITFLAFACSTLDTSCAVLDKGGPGTDGEPEIWKVKSKTAFHSQMQNLFADAELAVRQLPHCSPLIHSHSLW